MKKKFILNVAVILLSLFGASCSEVDQSDIPAYAEENNSVRTPHEAIEIALNAAETFFNNPENMQARSQSHRSVGSTLQVKVKYSDVLSRSGEITPLYYVVNFDNEEGFAIIAANDSIDPVLAVTERGSYYPGEPTEIAGFDDFMGGVENYLSTYKLLSMPRDTMPGLPLKPAVIIDTVKTYLEPRVKAKWGQNGILGKYCPNPSSQSGITYRYAGCGPIAIAQAFSYTRHFNQLICQAPEIKGKNITLNWDNLENHKHVGEAFNYECLCPVSNEDHLALAALCREIGYQTGSNYNLMSTSSDSNLLYYYLCGSLGNTNVTFFHNSDNILDQIRYGVAIILGTNHKTDESHYWLADGFYKIEVVKTEERWPTIGETDPNPTIITTTTTHALYYHYNWGWDGRNNGYFKKGIYDTSRPWHYDNEMDSTLYFNFSSIYCTIGLKK